MKEILLETAHLSTAENAEFHKAMLKSLEAISAYFNAPYAARTNLRIDMKVANNVINTFARIRQSESGHEMVIIQRARMVCEGKRELKEYLDENLPHISSVKKLRA